MDQLANCPECDGLYIRNAFRDTCAACYKKEEELLNTIYQFIRKRQNRMATVEQVTIATGVSEKQIQKFIQQGRLRVREFPNLGYSCSGCGALIQAGSMCENCLRGFEHELHAIKEMEERSKQANQEGNSTYRAKKSMS
ncbi:TIGR03826 family flagellar region protein [Priestia abyssalis]|uniref:TIGR03826 family flagellar region protein n=1 Tax=Priestia abyssalis TaxID=1221450 RepID=UPI000995A969|nr:TIGR03826 family flagellar region protein [Priestia abyssalis]